MRSYRDSTIVNGLFHMIRHVWLMILICTLSGSVLIAQEDTSSTAHVWDHWGRLNELFPSLLDISSPAEVGRNSTNFRVSLLEFDHDAEPSLLKVKKPSFFLLPNSTGLLPGVLLPNSTEYMPGFFCKMEHKIEAKSKLAPRFRLGSVNYINWMEGKGEWYSRYWK